MGWQADITNMVRVLINDLSETPDYSDERIAQVITVAARYVQFDVQLDREYTVDSLNNTITPDPTAENDDIFLCLVGLRAACMIDQSTFRTKALLNGISASLGPAKLSVAGNLAGFVEILNQGPCKLYADLSEHWDVQQATSIAAILSPFVGNKFDPTYLRYPGDNRRDIYS